MGCLPSKEKCVDDHSTPKKINQVLELGDLSKNSELQDKFPVKTSDVSSTGMDKIKWDPRVLDKYNIQGQIGKGKFSLVFRAANRESKHPCAIKVPIKDLLEKDILLHERDITRMLKHPYIVQLVEAITTKHGKTLLVMELALGGTLYEKIRMKRGIGLPENEVIRVTSMLLNALNYLHSRGITHRDIKPQNVLFYHTGIDSKVLLTGFQHAAVRPDGKDIYMNNICGTPEYFAPEIVERKPYTSVVDVWAVGVVTFYSLTGSLPFHNKEKIVMFKKILAGDYDKSNKILQLTSEGSRVFISSLLNIEPGRRLSAADALTSSWFDIHISNYPTEYQKDSSSSSDSSSLYSPAYRQSVQARTKLSCSVR